MRRSLFTVVVLVALAGCAGRPATELPVNVREPEAARALAQTELGLLAGGDYGAAWDLWTDEAKRVVTRDAFVRLDTRCPVQRGIPAVVEDTRPVGADAVEVRWRRGDVVGTDRVVHVGGGWRFQPSGSTLDGYLSRVASC